MTRFRTAGRPGGKRDCLNPYRIGARLILDRLTWDLSLTAWRQRRKLRRLRDTHEGKKAVIMCNGPSLLDVDLSALQSVFSIGLNKINLLFHETEFRPSVIVAVNPLVLEQNAEFYSRTEIPLFLDRQAKAVGVDPRENVYLIHTSDFPYFARDCSISVFQGFTVTYVALQLAYHMGFTDVALVGCDHDYGVAGAPNAISVNKGRDPGHFNAEYFAPGQPWQFPDLIASEHYYDLARRCYEDSGRRIVNASSRTRLSVFPRMALEEFLGNG